MLGVLARHTLIWLQFLTPVLALKDIRHRKGKKDWETLWRLGDEKMHSRWNGDRKGLSEIHSGIRRLFDLGRPAQKQSSEFQASERAATIMLANEMETNAYKLWTERDDG